MKLAKSRVTSQGQVSVPAEVRKRLGLAPGSVLEWDIEDDQVVIRRAGQYSSEELHRTLFRGEPKPHGLDELKEEIRTRMRKRYARR